MAFVIIDPAPVADDDINATEVDIPVTGNVLTNDSDDNPTDSLTVADPATGDAATGVVTIITTGGGTVVINPDGTYEYTPATGFTGEDTFDYTVIDTFGKTDTATVSIEVRNLNGPVDPADPSTIDNAPPIATDDVFTSLVDVPVTSSVISNDTDPDGDVIAIADSTGAEATVAQTILTTAGGTVTLNTDGTFTYVPPTGFIGEDTFDYTIVDPSGATDTAVVTLNVAADPDPAENDDPEAGNDLASAIAGQPATVNLLDNDTDPNGDPLAITDVDGNDPSAGPITIVDPVTGDTQGTLEIDPITGEATFTPEPGFVGTVQVPYTIDDGNDGTDTATMTFVIIDPAPVAEDDINATEVDVPVSGNVLTNDSDDNPADSLTVADPATEVAATGPVTITTTAGGTVVINPDGTYEYTPAAGFTGEDTFDYTVVDTFGKTDTATVSIEVRDLNEPVDPSDPVTIDNAPPIATDDVFASLVDVPLTSSVISNDTDPDSDVIAIADLAGVLATAPQTIPTTAGGTVTLNTDGSFTYVPPTGFIGEDTFDYTIVDPSGATDTAVVTLNVAADPDPTENDDPQAGNDLASAIAGQAATANLLDNDTDPNGDPLTISDVDGNDPSAGPISIVDPVTGDPQGTLAVDPVTGEATFTPEPGFTGTVQVPYTIDDGNGGTDTATMTFVIIDPAPVADDDINATEVDIPVSGNVLTNDSDDNPTDSLTVADPATDVAATGPVTVTTTGGGTVVINPDGTYEYTPEAGFTGGDTFDYTVIDTFGKTDTATVSIEVRDLNGPVDPADPSTIDNAPPIATDDVFTSLVDVSLTSSVISNDTDPDSDVIAIAGSTGVEATTPQTITTTEGGSVTLNTDGTFTYVPPCLLYTSPSPRDATLSRMPSSA